MPRLFSPKRFDDATAGPSNPLDADMASLPEAGFWREQMARTFWHSLRRNTRWTRSLPPLGRSFLAAMGVSLVFCVDPSHRGARLVFAFCLVALIVCAFWARSAPLRSIRARRALPDFVRANEPFAYTLTVENESNRPLSRIDGRDGARFSAPNPSAWAQATWWADRSVRYFDRLVGYPRWLAMAEQSESVAGERFFISRLNPQSSTRLSALGLCRRRGVRSFGGMWIGSRDPFGLWRALRWVEAPDELICLPARGPRLTAAPAPGAAAGSLKKTTPTPVAHGEHLAGLRLWRSADGRRSIAWRASERAGTLLAREWSQPADQARALALDPRLPEADSPQEARRLFENLLAAAFDWSQAQSDVTVVFYSQTGPRELRAGRSGDYRADLAAFAQCLPIEGPKGFSALEETLSLARDHAGGQLLASARLDAATHALARRPGAALTFLTLQRSPAAEAGASFAEGGVAR